MEPALSAAGAVTETFRGLSLWHDTVADDLAPRAELVGEERADVAIVGAGLTGLWTAYYLLRRAPGLRVTLVEKEIAGFGASGRNGGWCSALFPASAAALERRHGRDAAIAMRRAMVDTVDEVADVVEREGIDCDFRRGGTLSFVRGRAQRLSAESEIAEADRFGVDRLEARLDAVRPFVFDPACASLHPAKLVRGLARAVEALGGRILEKSEVVGWKPGLVHARRGTVRADAIVVATEGYGATLPAMRRTVLPLYSLMIATEPMPESFWAETGIGRGQTFTDYRHLLVYGQRTADDRVAFGGRGARYHFGSAIRPRFDRVPRVFQHLERALADFFPGVGPVRISHRWGGPLGVPRDWHASVAFDAGSRIGRAGGYVGDGLSTTNLAGRTLAALITGGDDEETRLPWVGHRSPAWEPEPLRFAGANLGLLGMGLADVEERLTGVPSRIARLIGPLVGH